MFKNCYESNTSKHHPHMRSTISRGLVIDIYEIKIFKTNVTTKEGDLQGSNIGTTVCERSVDLSTFVF